MEISWIPWPAVAAQRTAFAVGCLSLLACFGTQGIAQQVGQTSPTSPKANSPQRQTQDLGTQLNAAKARIEQLEGDLKFERSVSDELMSRALRSQPEPAPREPTPATNPTTTAKIPPSIDAPVLPTPPKPMDQPPHRTTDQPAYSSADIDALVRTACGLWFRDTSGAPGAKGLIIVSAQRRSSIEEALRIGGAPATDVEAINVDACFSLMGADYVVVTPPDKRDLVVSVVGGDESSLSRWLSKSAVNNSRVRLAPSSECPALLEHISSRGGSASAVWVELDAGPSRCERDSDGSAHVDPNKVGGYGGVIVLKVQRS